MREQLKASLKNFAQDSSYSRGLDYYGDGKVESIKWEDHKIIGEVQGTKKYTVFVSYLNDEFIFLCTCPYEFGGICKHCVAVGLELVNGNYELNKFVAKDDNTETAKKGKIEELIRQATDEEVNSFLKTLLQESCERVERFKTFIKGRLEIEEKIEIE